jgi:hypothetical protein
MICALRLVFSYNSCVPGASHAAGLKMEPVKVDNVIHSEKKTISLSIRDSSYVPKNFLLTIWNDGKCYIRCNESREIFGGNVMHSHDEDSESCLHRHILNNSVKRKAIYDLCERTRKLIHKELQSQDLDILTYKDKRNISRNIHRTRSYQLLPLPTDTEESHETFSVVQMLTISKEQCLILNNLEKIL